MLNRCIDKEEIIDNLEFADTVLIKNLKEMAFLNRWLGYNKTLTNAINAIYEKYREDFHARNIRIADLGCGSGDSLRYLHDWMVKKQINMDLLGIDGNAFVVDFARNTSLAYPKIRYQLMDVAKPMNFEENYDILILSNFCHHFSDSEIAGILKYLYNCTQMAIIINDIHRHPLAYLGIKILTNLFNFSRLAKHDAPLSVLRAFSESDLRNILNSAKISVFEIHWTWPFRWQVTIWTKI